MERYSKTHKSKWQSQYSEEFKLKVCNEYINGNDGIRFLEKKHGLGNSRLTTWLKLYGLGIRKTIYLPLDIMTAKKKPVGNSNEALSLKLLRKQFEDALLEKELYRRMVEVAERELHIDIKKKSGTK
ncbi:hypothetical protein [Pedobacter jejuensis]|uniref:Transposase n=1 Tax=Pedobacter jejuensis TaxID=1268550 RepID=A0A3N0BR77_9SPHI|nr:hypothetical protein [Pedobacter jejuensis]RNL51473.1 hypothetical protein D7004_14365 [Pedobacter jejuensis]